MLGNESTQWQCREIQCCLPAAVGDGFVVAALGIPCTNFVDGVDLLAVLLMP